MLDVSGTLISDGSLEHLSKFAALESLDLSETLVTDEGIKHLARMPRLKNLHLRRVMVSSKGISSLGGCPNLETVWLADLPLWPEAFEGLAQAARLEQLIVGNGIFSGGSFDREAIEKMRTEKLAQEQAVFSLGSPSVFLAIEREEISDNTVYLRWLLEHGADANERAREFTPLATVVQRNDLDAVRALLEYGAQVNVQDQHGRTPLSLSIVHGNLELIRLLLTAGADPSVGEPPVLVAVTRGRNDVIRLLAEHGANLNRGAKNYTPLLAAMRDASTLQALLDSGADPNLGTTKEGNTPLHVAAAAGNADSVKVLLAHGADAAAKNADGETAYDFARKKLDPQQAAAAEILNLLQPTPAADR
jgi:ankyrin repeat protein